MKKKLLFVIPNLGAGGAEKSLVNLLNELDYSIYEIDLFLFSKSGLFYKQVPSQVNIVEPNTDFKIFQNTLLKSLFVFLMKGKISLLISRFLFFFINQWMKNKSVAEQKTWSLVKKSMKKVNKNYDCGIAFLEKSSIYFLVDFVKASKKIGYIHNDYDQLGLNLKFDLHYFHQLDNIVTVSESCKTVLENKVTPKNKVKLIYNISSPRLLNSLADEFSVDNVGNKIKLLTIARLENQKGIDIAIEAAKILKNKKLNFIWEVIGEGSEREKLSKLIEENNIEEYFKLLGLRENPYPYLKNCNFYVQSSRFEGKSIAIDEALILKKLIIVTDFSTAADQIKHRKNGIIAEMNAEALSGEIWKLYNDPLLQESILQNLDHQVFDYEEQLAKFNLLVTADL